MRQIHLITLIFLINLTAAYSQNVHQGYIITNQNDTIYGTIIYGSADERNKLVEFTDPAFQTTTAFRPYQLKGYFANNEFYESCIYDESKGFGYGLSVFMKRLNDGYVRIYEFWNNTQVRPFKQLLLAKGGSDTLVFISQLKFKQQMMKLLEDCPEIVEKIYDSKYKRKDILLLANDYNNWRKDKAKKLTQN